MVSFPFYSQPVTVEIDALPLQKVPTNPPVVTAPKALLIDGFEDGDFTKFREWWTFDKVVPTIVQNQPSKTHYIESYSMQIAGSSNNWYAGGVGTYLNEDAQHFTVLKLVIFAPKQNAGAIRIELYDDDNNNATVDIDPDTGLPAYDDVFIYDLNIMWEGWKVVTIPLSDFVDFNATVGDNVWNPSKDYGSSGLVQMQLVVLSSKFKSETIDFLIDTIKLN